jgi:hypothetical protein
MQDLKLPIPAAARSKAWVRGHSLVGIGGSNSVVGHGCLSSVDKNPCGGLIPRIEESLLHVMSKPQQTEDKDLGPLR